MANKPVKFLDQELIRKATWRTINLLADYVEAEAKTRDVPANTALNLIVYESYLGKQKKKNPNPLR